MMDLVRNLCFGATNGIYQEKFLFHLRAVNGISYEKFLSPGVAYGIFSEKCLILELLK